MRNYYEKFTNYIVNNYDLKDKNIINKYSHSARVACLMILLAKRLNLPMEDVTLAFKIGLFHDLGRFREVERNKDKERVFNNRTFDHGAYSNKILFNDGLIREFDVRKEDYLVIRKALYYHNKKDLDDNLTEREELFCKMIRDVDKLDILYNRTGGSLLPNNLLDNIVLNDDNKSDKKRLKLKAEPNEVLLNNYFNDETIDIKNIISSGDSDSTIFYLSFIKDLYFDESFEIAINNGYLGRLISFIDVDESKRELFNDLLNKIKERTKRNVREKVQSLKC